VIAVTAVGLLISYAIKSQCAFNLWADNFQYRNLCYNDIQPLFIYRGVSDGLIPYIDARYEYPVLTGIFMDLVGRILRGLEGFGVANINENYLQLTTLALAPFGFVVSIALRRKVSLERFLIWGIGTPLILYAFHNWDLIAVALATVAIVAFEDRENEVSGGAFAAGASAKLYPAFLLPGALLHRWAEGNRRGAIRMGVAFVLVFLVLNLPWIPLSSGVPPVFDREEVVEIAREAEIRDPESNGWMGIWTFHAARYPDFGTVWYWIAHHGRVLAPSDFWRIPQGEQSSGYRDFVSIASLLIFAFGCLFFLRVGWLRRNEPGGYPVLATGLGIVAVFLLVSKVHSPQYALWLVPLLALLDVPWRYVIGYLVTDAAVFVSGFYYFTVMEFPAPTWQGIFEVAVLGRAMALALLAVSAVTAKRLVPKTFAT
jgi:uncharacterized membrane protein